MRNMNRLLLFVVMAGLFLLPGESEGREASDTLRVYYRLGYRYVDREYRDNGAALDRFLDRLRASFLSGRLERVDVLGGASPEGSARANDRLACLRVDSLTSYLSRISGVPRDFFAGYGEGVSWRRLRVLVASSDMPDRDAVLRVLDESPLWRYDEQGRVVGGMKQELMDLRGGTPYRYMAKHFFAEMRSSAVAILIEGVSSSGPDAVPEVAASVPEPNVSAEPLPAADSVANLPATAPATNLPATDSVTNPPATVPVETDSVGLAEALPSEWSPELRVKTNGIGWVFLVANVAVEADLSRLFSLHVPVYYSACDYFTHRAKFRFLGTQPELRVWPERSRRFFAGVHFGVGSYNVATGGTWRYQDAGGHSPALGGGVSVGYRLPVGRAGRWGVEFALGAGAYRAHYDRFRLSDGSYAGSRRKTYVGLDNAAVSVTYGFGLKKKNER